MTEAPAISVIVPAYNEPRSALEALHASLVAQTFSDFEVIVVDDHSTAPDYAVLSDPRFRVIYKRANSGPAASRNLGASEARAPVLFFTDADCRLHPDTLTRVYRGIARESVCVGNTITDASSFIGKAIGYLGFPGGGLLGFHNVWQVSEHGYTQSISSCNLAVRTGVFRSLGGFDESFPVPAGEDTMLARSALQSGLRIRYLAEQIVFHEERASLAGFVRWQVTRGRGAYHVKRRAGRIGGYVARRFRSFGGALRRAGPRYGPAVAALFCLSLLCQWCGFQSEAKRHGSRAARE